MTLLECPSDSLSFAKRIPEWPQRARLTCWRAPGSQSSFNTSWGSKESQLADFTNHRQCLTHPRSQMLEM